MTGFKDAGLAIGGDDPVKSAEIDGKSGGIQKLWNEIIPSNAREELEEEERQELAEMHLGPRLRKIVLGGVENENNRKRGSQSQKKSVQKVCSVKIGKVSVNPKTLLIKTETLLRPLGKVISSEAVERRSWVLDITLTDAHFDDEQDSKLLVGIWEHGLGSWEQVKADKALKLGRKILLNSSCKPQSKHLNARAAYLLGMLQRKAKQGKLIKKKKVWKAKESTDNPNKEYKSKVIIEDNDSFEKERKNENEEKKEKPQGALGSVHIGSNELLLKSELNPATSAQCKERKRNVKSLKALDKSGPGETQEEQVTQLITSPITSLY